MTDRQMQSNNLNRMIFTLGILLMLCIPHNLWNNLYAVLFALAVILFYGRWSRRLPGGGIAGCIVLFLALCVLSPLWSYAPLSGLRTAVFYLTGAAFGLLSAGFFHSPGDTDSLFVGLYAALILTSVYGLIRHFRGMDLYGVVIGDTVLPRLCATLEHAINYAEFIALAFPLALVWALNRPGKRAQYVLLSLMALPLAALALTYSRTGYIALGFAFLILIRPWRKPWLMIAAAAVMLLLLPGTVQERALSLLTVSDVSASGRFTLWRECLSMLRQHWLPGTGLGTDNFLAAYLPCSTGTLPFTPPHSNMGYLEIFLSLGIVGGLAFLGFFFGIFPRLRRAIRTQENLYEKQILRALEASLAGAALANIPEHIWFYPRILFIWSVIYGLAYSFTS